jgi:uncharacterized protein (TIGR02265 family)
VEFRRPDYSGPLDIDAQLARASAGIHLHTLYPRMILEHARGLGRPIPTGRFFAKKDRCSMRELLAFLPMAAGIIYPDVPVREGLRRLGRLSHHALVASPAGRRIFDGAHDDVAAYLRRVPEGVRASGNHARASIVVADGRAILSIDDYSSFVEGAIGAIEAAIDDAGAKGAVRVRRRGDRAWDLEIRWTDAG